MIDLGQFCCPDECEPGRDLSVPFSLNGHTYATNGHICVRVPRRPDIPENKEAPNPENLEWDFSRMKFGPLPEGPLREQCRMCDGRGYEHDCPDCRRECEHCDGIGEQLLPPIRIGEARFKGVYISWIRELPGLEIGKPKPVDPLPFRFDGGEGLLMPMRPEARE
jgi:hypothetical protein